MKGFFITEFVAFAETRFSLKIADAMLAPQGLPSDGVYTQVGTYDHQELKELVRRLSRLSYLSGPQLFREFGQYLYGRMATQYSRLCARYTDCFDLLTHLHTHIHHEIGKLYPDAETPVLKVERIDADHLILQYESARGLSDLAEGLISGCVQHFGEKVDIIRDDDARTPGTRTCFRLTRQPNP